MPVRAGVISAPPPVAIPVASGPQPVPLQITYIDPDGNMWPLTDLELPGGYICTGISGWAGPPVSLSTSPLPRGGAIPLQFLVQPRQVILGLYAEAQGGAAGQMAYLDLLDQITRAFYTSRNDDPAPGSLVVQRPDGSSRQVSVLCTAGLDQPEESPDTSGPLWTTWALTLEADDPFFEDTATIGQTFYGVTTAAGILPLLPIALASSSVLGAAVVLNDGGADAYPVWTITGPGTPTLANSTTGRSFGLSSALAAGQVVQVDTRPGQQAATDLGTHANLWSSLVQSSPRDLWPLVPGTNDLSITLSGATSASSVVLSYKRRWLRA